MSNSYVSRVHASWLNMSGRAVDNIHSPDIYIRAAALRHEAAKRKIAEIKARRPAEGDMATRENTETAEEKRKAQKEPSSSTQPPKWTPDSYDEDEWIPPEYWGSNWPTGPSSSARCGLQRPSERELLSDLNHLDKKHWTHDAPKDHGQSWQSSGEEDVNEETIMSAIQQHNTAGAPIKLVNGKLCEKYTGERKFEAPRAVANLKKLVNRTMTREETSKKRMAKEQSQQAWEEKEKEKKEAVEEKEEEEGEWIQLEQSRRLSQPVHYDDDPSTFKRTAHLQINTAEHVLAQAWVWNYSKPMEEWPGRLVYHEWIYPEDVEKVEGEIWKPLREASEQHCFSLQKHTLQFRWSCK